MEINTPREAASLALSLLDLTNLRDACGVRQFARRRATTCGHSRLSSVFCATRKGTARW